MEGCPSGQDKNDWDWAGDLSFAMRLEGNEGQDQSKGKYGAGVATGAFGFAGARLYLAQAGRVESGGFYRRGNYRCISVYANILVLRVSSLPLWRWSPPSPEAQ